ncbi:ABC transporter [Fusarium albosuccineum]|uniref:ABC transporter n=1 Tax=Fusarium albosuccineum TaxID=1237068 RepID=A0A8H4PJ84_9HYPO|nr:ABC transporter [Fusarium albosuccineum]
MSTTQRTPTRLFIQMSGAPGSGKSTIARLLRSSIGGGVIDHDVLRSSLLESGNIPFDQAAKEAYLVQWRLAQDFMRQGLNLIIDSCCNYPEVLDQGSTLASQNDYVYWYVETRVPDIDLLDKRLRTRDPMSSQRTGVDCPPVAAQGDHIEQDSRVLFKKWIESPSRPENNAIIVNSTDNPAMLRDQILKRIVG